MEGTAVGSEFLLFFTGAVGPIPFERVHLPAFVLPRLHAPLSGLLSANPLVGQRIRKTANPPVAHPGRGVSERSEQEQVVSTGPAFQVVSRVSPPDFGILAIHL